MILITHDLGVVAETADSVAVMYAGRIVETAPVTALFDAPQHPYTLGLFASLEAPVETDVEPARRLPEIPARCPRYGRSPKGCSFAPRCPRAAQVLRRNAGPTLDEIVRVTAQPAGFRVELWRP